MHEAEGSCTGRVHRQHRVNRAAHRVHHQYPIGLRAQISLVGNLDRTALEEEKRSLIIDEKAYAQQLDLLDGLERRHLSLGVAAHAIPDDDDGTAARAAAWWEKWKDRLRWSRLADGRVPVEEE